MFLIRGRLEGKALPERVPEVTFEAPPTPVLTNDTVQPSPVPSATGPVAAEEVRNEEPPPPYQENIPEDTR